MLGHTFAVKLNSLTPLGEEDMSALKAACADRVRKVPLHTTLVVEGRASGNALVVLSGWVCKYKSLSDGRRSIVSLTLPGDIVDFNPFALKRADHSIATLSNATIAEFSFATLNDLLARPDIHKAMWLSALLDMAIQREWTLSLGRRTAIERLSHLICETYLRLRRVGFHTGSACGFPLTQAEIAEATGLSVVHVNRTLQELRRLDLIRLNRSTLTVLDLPQLQALAGSSLRYLQLENDGETVSGGASTFSLPLAAAR